MMHPIRTARAMWGTARAGWGEILGFACVVGDLQATVRSFRATRADNKQLGSTRRTAALVAARKGCTHTPPCPPATAPDRQKAEVIYEDDQFIYLCNGLTLSVQAGQAAPDFPPIDLGSPKEVLFP